MATDYGTDISAVPDIDPMMPDVSGRAVLSEAIYRRFITPRGSLFYDPDYGYDLRGLLGEQIDVSEVREIETDVTREALKDQRIRAARARVTYNTRTRTLLVSLSLQDASGPFSLVLSIDQVSVQILNAQSAGLEV